MSGKQAKLQRQQERQQERQRQLRGRDPLPRRPLPVGYTLETLNGLDTFDEINNLAGQSIAGYAGKSASLAYRKNLETKLVELFGKDPSHPTRVRTIALKGPDGTIRGGVLTEPFLAEDVLDRDPERVRTIAKSHTVLSAIFVSADERGRGFGEILFKETIRDVRSRGGIYLDGFADDRTGSADFYHHLGAVVLERNTNLPPRPPSNAIFAHDPRMHGRWFYIDVRVTASS